MAKVSDSLAKMVRNLERGDTARAAESLRTRLEILTKPARLSEVNTASAAALATKMHAYVLPHTLVEQYSTVWLKALIACGANAEGSMYEQRACWLLSLIHVLYGGLISHLEGQTYTQIVLSAEQCESLVSWMTTAAGIPEDSRPPPADKTQLKVHRQRQCWTEVGLGYLPKAYNYEGADLLLEMDSVMPYAYLGMVAFALYKGSTTQTQSLTVARPKALRLKYRWAVDEGDRIQTTVPTPMLDGSLRPSLQTYMALPHVWAMIPQVRNEVFKYFVSIAGSAMTMEDEAVFTSVRLMKWADMSHIPIIGQFIQRYPAVRYFEQLRGELDVFDHSIHQLLDYCPPILDDRGRQRKSASGQPLVDVSIMPFMKIFMGDKGDMGKRNTMPNLLAVAVGVLRQTDVQLQQYTAPPDSLRLTDEFILFEKALRQRIVDLDEENGGSSSDEEDDAVVI